LSPILSKKEKNMLYQLSKKGMANDVRRGAWLVVTGAKNMMDFYNNYFPGKPETYYMSLLKYNIREAPNPNIHQIQVDLPRTFPDEEFY
jgi:hypothetical protein